MSMEFRMVTEGLPELAARLRAMKDDFTREILTEALRQSAEPVRVRASALAKRGRVAPHLADHIVTSVARDVDDRIANMPTIIIGPSKDFFYGFFLEFGTIYMRAQPFLRPAFDAEWEATFKTLGEVTWAILKKRTAGPSSGGGTL